MFPTYTDQRYIYIHLIINLSFLFFFQKYILHAMNIYIYTHTYNSLHSMVSTITTMNFHISLQYQCLIWKLFNVKVRGSICHNVQLSFSYMPVFQYSKKKVQVHFPQFTSVKVEPRKQNERIYYFICNRIICDTKQNRASDNSKLQKR